MTRCATPAPAAVGRRSRTAAAARTQQAIDGAIADRRDGPLFGEVFAARGGFDAVIGNPPYTRVQELRRHRPEETTAYIGKYRAAAQGSFDIAFPFVERA